MANKDHLAGVERRLASVQATLSIALAGISQLQKVVNKMSKVVDDLVGQVAAQKTVVDSAKSLLEKLFALIQAGIDTGDLAKVQAALDDLKAQGVELSDAVVANTPAATPAP